MSDYYNEGYDAFHQGYIPIDNPYNDGTYAHSQWAYGYEAAEELCPIYGETF